MRVPRARPRYAVNGANAPQSVNGAGATNPPPARCNLVAGTCLPLGDQWNAGYLEGEDSCGDTGDFTIDFDDRGMDSNQTYKLFGRLGVGKL